MREKPLILLIDDEEIFLEIASVKLNAEGFETVITHEVSEALAKAEELQPDLVLSDIYMPPGPNGWDLALALRRNQKTRNIKLAFFTSLRDPLLELQADRERVVAEIGRVTFFSKSDDVDTLASGIRALVNLKA